MQSHWQPVNGCGPMRPSVTAPVSVGPVKPARLITAAPRGIVAKKLKENNKAY